MPSCPESRLRLTITKGKTFTYVLRPGTERVVYRNITGISRAGPCVVTAPAHGLVEGWPFRIANAGGMSEINSANRAMAPDGGWFQATVLTADTIEINAVNSAGYAAYTTGGQIEYPQPLDLAAFSAARMQIRADPDAEDILLELTTANNRILFDNAAKTITLKLLDTITAALDWDSAVTDIELVATNGDVSLLVSADVIAQHEVTR